MSEFKSNIKYAKSVAEAEKSYPGIKNGENWFISLGDSDRA